TSWRVVGPNSHEFVPGVSLKHDADADLVLFNGTGQHLGAGFDFPSTGDITIAVRLPTLSNTGNRTIVAGYVASWQWAIDVPTNNTPRFYILPSGDYGTQLLLTSSVVIPSGGPGTVVVRRSAH